MFYKKLRNWKVSRLEILNSQFISASPNTKEKWQQCLHHQHKNIRLGINNTEFQIKLGVARHPWWYWSFELSNMKQKKKFQVLFSFKTKEIILFTFQSSPFSYFYSLVNETKNLVPAQFSCFFRNETFSMWKLKNNKGYSHPLYS